LIEISFCPQLFLGLGGCFNLLLRASLFFRFINVLTIGMDAHNALSINGVWCKKPIDSGIDMA